MFDSIILALAMKNRFPLNATIVECFFDGTQKKSKHFVILNWISYY